MRIGHVWIGCGGGGGGNVEPKYIYMHILYIIWRKERMLTAFYVEYSAPSALSLSLSLTSQLSAASIRFVTFFVPFRQSKKFRSRNTTQLRALLHTQSHRHQLLETII